MDRAATIAWIDDLARDTGLLSAPVDVPVLAEISRVNPTCGDRVALALHLTTDGAVHLRGSVRGCTLSTAATVLAAAALEAMPVASAHTLIAAATRQRLTGTGDETVLDDELGRLAALDLVPLRRRCVALPWQVIGELLAG